MNETNLDTSSLVNGDLAGQGSKQSEVGERLHFLFLNMGHFLDHLFMLVFATVAALVLVHEWNLSYTELIPYATPGFIAFAAFTIPAGWPCCQCGMAQQSVSRSLFCHLVNHGAVSPADRLDHSNQWRSWSFYHVESDRHADFSMHLGIAS